MLVGPSLRPDHSVAFSYLYAEGGTPLRSSASCRLPPRRLRAYRAILGAMRSPPVAPADSKGVGLRFKSRHFFGRLRRPDIPETGLEPVQPFGQGILSVLGRQ
jgi:hypothetical protein